MTLPDASAAGRFDLGDGLSVNRLGYGAMRITGEGVWGDPADRDRARSVLRRAVELGVDLIDTADSYGPAVSEDLIREALRGAGSNDPYGGVVVATKAGLVRTGPGQWHPLGRPTYLRQCVEMSLRRLDVERIDLFQLHRIDPEVAAEDQFGLLAELQAEGKVRLVGLSEVGVDDLEQAQAIVDVATVQNRYNLLDRGSEAVLRWCEERGVGFLPWFPIANQQLADPDGAPAATIRAVAAEAGATPAQVALAWLLHRSPVQLPIPGTGSIAHLEDNVASAAIGLDADQQARLDAVA